MLGGLPASLCGAVRATPCFIKGGTLENKQEEAKRKENFNNFLVQPRLVHVCALISYAEKPSFLSDFVGGLFEGGILLFVLLFTFHRSFFSACSSCLVYRT
jgi:hypothetical protein